MSIIKKAQGTAGAEAVIAALQKHRIIVSVYIALELTSSIVSTIQPISSRTFLLSIIALILPIGIAIAIFYNNVKSINFYRCIFIAGFIGSLILIIYNLYIQICLIVPKGFVDYDLFMKCVAYMNIVDIISLIIVNALFLLILIFNVTSRKIGILIFILLIISMILILSSYIIIFNSVSIGNFTKIQIEHIPQFIIGQVKMVLAFFFKYRFNYC